MDFPRAAKFRGPTAIEGNTGKSTRKSQLSDDGGDEKCWIVHNESPRCICNSNCIDDANIERIRGAASSVLVELHMSKWPKRHGRGDERHVPRSLHNMRGNAWRVRRLSQGVAQGEGWNDDGDVLLHVWRERSELSGSG